MQVVILCGGLGTRLSEETQVKPKPMVEIGEKPILWHIMKGYSHFGFKDFILALGYKSNVIKDYFLNYHPLTSDIVVELGSGKTEYFNTDSEDWIVRMINTGQSTLTGGRLNRLENQLRPKGTFMMTYGDGVSDIDINELLAFHKRHGKLATVTAVHPTARFGTMLLEGNSVVEFSEKSQTGEGWINGGFFVLEPGVFDYLKDDMTVFEKGPLETLASDGQLESFKHEGFWHCMDTIRDKNFLEGEWIKKQVPWKKWGDE